MGNIRIISNVEGKSYAATIESRKINLLQKAFKKYKFRTKDVEVSIGYNGRTLDFIFCFENRMPWEISLTIPGQSVGLPKDCKDGDKIKTAICEVLNNINDYNDIQWDRIVESHLMIKRDTGYKDRQERKKEN